MFFIEISLKNTLKNHFENIRKIDFTRSLSFDEKSRHFMVKCSHTPIRYGYDTHTIRIRYAVWVHAVYIHSNISLIHVDQPNICIRNFLDNFLTEFHKLKQNCLTSSNFRTENSARPQHFLFCANMLNHGVDDRNFL